MIGRLAVRFCLWVALATAFGGCAGGAVAPGAAPKRSAPAEASPRNVVAIPEPPAEDAESEPDDAPPVTRRDARFPGEWLEDWPNRGTCSDRVEVRMSGRGIEVSGSDCTDGKAYEYQNARVEDGRLKFTLLVPETNRVLHYALEAVEDDKLVGEVNGGAEATVTWRRP